MTVGHPLIVHVPLLLAEFEKVHVTFISIDSEELELEFVWLIVALPLTTDLLSPFEPDT